MNIRLPEDLSVTTILAIASSLVCATWAWAVIDTRLQQQDRAIASLERNLERERTERAVAVKEWEERLRILERDTLKRMIWVTRPDRPRRAVLED